MDQITLPEPSAELLKLVADNFAPAESVQDAEMKRTTEDIYFTLSRHAPGVMWGAEDVYRALVKLQYKSLRVGDEMLWLLCSPRVV